MINIENANGPITDGGAGSTAPSAAVDGLQPPLATSHRSSTPPVASSSLTSTPRPKIRYRTLYFIRHGEAKHNILEKAARKKAKEDAIAEGHAEDSEETKRRMEVARQEILNNEALLDASLSPMGFREAEGARNDIEGIIKGKNIPPPTEVLVSPLQRALQTARIVFPGHKNVRVREEVRERLTGKACDSRTSTFTLARRDTFKNFSMTRQMRNSFKRRAKALPERIVESLGSRMDTAKSISFRSFFGHSDQNAQDSFSSSNGGTVAAEAQDAVSSTPVSSPPTKSTVGPDSGRFVEDKYALRERTRKLFDLIAESKHDAIAVVTHKGFLRELERGPFGQEDATEFSNCEVRVYKAGFTGTSINLQHVERIA